MTYENIIEDYGQSIDGEEVVFLRREPRSERLLVSLATHNNNGKYASLVSYSNRFKGDVLFLADRSNSYYLQNDGGVRYKGIISKFVKGYSSKNIVFSGSSMAGYAALDMALFFNSNAIVNNPQINLDVTMLHSWPELLANIQKIGKRRNIEELSYVSKNRSSVVAALFGRHEIDSANLASFFEIFIKNPGTGLIFGHCHDAQHKYYYPSVDDFFTMLNRVIEQRNLLDNINKDIPIVDV